MILRSLLFALFALVSSAASAAPEMRVAKTPHFTIYAGMTQADIRRFAQQLEDYDAVLRKLTGIAPDTPPVPLTLYVRPDARDDDFGYGVLGLYRPVAAGPLALVPLRVYGFATDGTSLMDGVARIVLFHEYAHHFVLQHFPALYSPWFVEGIAEFYSTVELTETQAILGKPEPLRIGTLARQIADLRLLLVPSDKGLNGSQTSELYARAWLLVHYLTLSKQRGGQINTYIRTRNSGASEDKAFQVAFGTTIPAMDNELQAYFKARSLSFAVIDRPRVSPEIEVRDATAGEIALARIVPRLRMMQSAEEGLTAYKTSRVTRNRVEHFAGRLALDARAMGRKLPDDAQVQTIVAEAQLVADREEDARAAATRALQLDPKNARAQLVMARLALGALQPGDTAGVAAARKMIVAANRAAPDDPLPLAAYYQSFADYKLTPTRNAVDGLERAFELAPQDDKLRMLVATEAVAAKNYTRAAELLRPVAFDPHPGPRRDQAQKLLAALPDNIAAAPAAVGNTAAATGPAAAPAPRTR